MSRIGTWISEEFGEFFTNLHGNFFYFFALKVGMMLGVTFLLWLEIFFIPGNKKEKQGSEILTMLLQALKNTVRSNSLPVQKILVSFLLKTISRFNSTIGHRVLLCFKKHFDGFFLLLFLTEGNNFNFTFIYGVA